MTENPTVPDMLPINRAQRRFLGLTLFTHDALFLQDFVPIEQVLVSPISRKLLGQRFQGAGQLQGGVLLGYQSGANLLVSALLPSNYLPQHPFDVQPEYVLGAIEAAIQVAAGDPLDWVGNWVMPPDGRPPEAYWIEEMWHQARSHALVSASQILLVAGMSDERLELSAWKEEEGKPLSLQVSTFG